MSFDVRHVARLARLSLSEEEERHLEADLRAILEFVGRLPEPLAPLEESPAPADAGLREDVPAFGLDRGRVLDGAPEHAEGLFLVPRVIAPGGRGTTPGTGA